MLHQKTHHPGMLHSRLHRPTVSKCLAVNIDRGLRMSNERHSYHQPSLDWPKRRPFEQPMKLLISLQLFAISGGGELSGAHSSQAWSLTNATGFNLYLDAEAQDGQLQRGSSCIGPDGQQRPGIKEVGEESTKESLKACLLRRQNTEVESRKAVLENSHMKIVHAFKLLQVARRLACPSEIEEVQGRSREALECIATQVLEDGCGDPNRNAAISKSAARSSRGLKDKLSDHVSRFLPVSMQMWHLLSPWPCLRDARSQAPKRDSADLAQLSLT